MDPELNFDAHGNYEKNNISNHWSYKLTLRSNSTFILIFNTRKYYGDSGDPPTDEEFTYYGNFTINLSTPGYYYLLTSYITKSGTKQVIGSYDKP